MRVPRPSEPEKEPLELVSAGAVVLAGPAEQPLVALIHRRSPAEWRLPKGKLEPGETPAQAAACDAAFQTIDKSLVTWAAIRNDYDLLETGQAFFSELFTIARTLVRLADEPAFAAGRPRPSSWCMKLLAPPPTLDMRELYVWPPVYSQESTLT